MHPPPSPPDRGGRPAEAPPVVAGLPSHKFAACRPDFLVVSAPKTGSTWLAANLRAHPALYVPAVKEVKFFSSLCKWLDAGWYLDQFAPGAGRVKGEASPSYALLPPSRIRRVRELFPDIKLVFLMRDPIGRAWSHAKHVHRYREASFAGTQSDFDAVTGDGWRAGFDHDWVAASGDYLGQLRRWLAVFPPSQVFVGFYESIAARPDRLLRDVFAFLGVDPAIDLGGFPVAERILAGPPGALPAELRDHLHGRVHARTVELAAYAEERFGLSAPPEWAEVLAPPIGTVPAAPIPAYERECDDGYLDGVLEQEETFPTAQARVFEDYLGYDFAYCRGCLHAVSRSVGPSDLPLGVLGADAATLRRLEERGDWHTAPSLAELKEKVSRFVAERTEAKAGALEIDLARARDRIGGLEAGLAEAIERLRRLESEAVRMTHPELALIERARRACQTGVRAWRHVRRTARRAATVFLP